MTQKFQDKYLPSGHWTQRYVIWSVDPKTNRVLTYLDALTNLEWQAEPALNKMNWKDALEYAENLKLDGGNWHLPTIEELKTLIVEGKTPASDLPGILGPERDQCWFWSSSANASNSSFALYVDFNYGYVFSDAKGSGLHVRCVRAGPLKI